MPLQRFFPMRYLCYNGARYYTAEGVVTLMPRDLPLGNGRLLVNLEKSYNLRDIYWPHVGQELHTAGDISHTGVRIDGKIGRLVASDAKQETVHDRDTTGAHATLSR